VHVSAEEWLLIATAVALAATVQGVVGFGGNLLAVPLVALVVPAALPGAMVLPSLPMVVAMAINERDHVDRRGSAYLLLGRLPGTALGVTIVALVSSEVLSAVIGALVLVAVAVSAFAAHLHPGVTPTTATVTGVATGVMGTAAAIEGPPLALLYQHDPPPVLRATLATQFAIGIVITLAGLALGAQLQWWQVLLGLSLMPSYGIGLALSIAVRPRVRGWNLRPFVLGVAAIAGLLAITRA
jgi:uncharacterized membrane protein YfcA